MEGSELTMDVGQCQRSPLRPMSSMKPSKTSLSYIWTSCPAVGVSWLFSYSGVHVPEGQSWLSLFLMSSLQLNIYWEGWYLYTEHLMNFTVSGSYNSQLWDHNSSPGLLLKEVLKIILITTVGLALWLGKCDANREGKLDFIAFKSMTSGLYGMGKRAY